MKAVVLVGGFGTRLRPLTLGIPKQILPIGSMTMLERVIVRLGSQGVTEAVLSLGYQPDAFIDAFPDGVCEGVSLEYAVEPEPLDTAGAIRFAAQSAGIAETFIALNGDVLTDLDISNLWSEHARLGGQATIALTPVEDPSRFGVVVVDREGLVSDFVEKPKSGTAPSNWINAGTYVIEPSVLEDIPEGGRVSIEREVFPRLVNDGSLRAVKSDAYWLDAGTPEAFLQAHLDLIDGVRGAFELAQDPTARIDADAKVVRSVVGAGAVVATGSTVVDSVVMAGARIASGASVERSIIGGRSTIGESCSLTDLTVVGFDQDVPAGSVAAGATFPSAESYQ